MPAKYRAFISYSHADSARGEWLHKALERYRVPSSYVGMKNVKGEQVEARLGTIFRDRDELTSGHDLAEAIRLALAASENLIVICSPAAARSRYVNQEITEFKRLGGSGRVHAVIVAGEPHASAIPGREDEECLPPSLRFDVDGDGRLTEHAAPEVLAPDLRPGRDEKNRALLKLIAGLLGIDFDVLYQRDRRRARLRRIALGAATSALAITLGVLGWTAFERSREARRQERLVAHDAYATALGLVETSTRAGQHDNAVELLKKHIPAPGASDFREFTWRHLWRPYDRHRHAVFVSGRTTSLDISPDGRRFAIANDSSLVTVWDVATAKEVARIEDRGEKLRNAFFVAGGQRLATESSQGEVRLWNLDHPSAPAGTLGKGLHPALSRERRTLIIARGLFPTLEMARLVNVERGTEIAIDPGDPNVAIGSYSISADERTVAFAAGSNVVLVIDAATGRLARRRAFPADWKVRDVNFISDGALLIEGAGRGTGVEIHVWDPAANRDGPALRVPPGPAGNVVAVAASANGDKIALLRGDATVASPRQESHLTVWERRTGRVLYDLVEERTGFVTAMQFSPTADVLATGSRNHEVKLWDASTGALKGVVGIHHGTSTREGEEERFHRAAGVMFSLSRAAGAGITDLLFSADGRSIVTASGEFAAVRTWDAAIDPEGQALPAKGDFQTAVAFSPNGRFVFTGDRSGMIAMWDAAKRIRTARVVGHSGDVLGLAVSPDGARLASASGDGIVKIWRTPQLTEEAAWKHAGGATQALVLRKDRLTHLTRRAEGAGPAAQTGTYDLQYFTLDGKPACCGTTVRADVIALSPEAHALASFTASAGGSGGGCAVAVWDVQRGRSEIRLGRDDCFRLAIRQLAWSQDGALLAVGGAAVAFGGKERSGTLAGVRVFDALSGRERSMLPLPIGHSHDSVLGGLSFSPDGRTLAALNVTADRENPQRAAFRGMPEVTVWDIATSSLKAALQVPNELCGEGTGAACLVAGAFSPDGAALSVVTRKPGGAESHVLFWRVAEKNFADTVTLRDDIAQLVLSPTGDRMAALIRSRARSGEPAILWDRSSSPKVAALGSFVPEITALHQAAEGHLLAQTREYPATFGAVSRVWDLKSGRQIAVATDVSATGAATGHRMIDVSQDGRFIGELSMDGRVTISKIGGSDPPISVMAESMEKGRPASFRPHPLVLFSANGARLATFGKSQTTVWDVATRKATYTVSGSVPAAFAAAADALATSEEDCKTITVTHAASGRRRAQVVSSEGCVKAVSLSPDGTRLLTIRSDRPLDDFVGDATVWDVQSGTVLATLRGYTDDGASVAAFAPDGRTIATAGAGGTINLWDPLTGRRLQTLAGPPVNVTSLSFARDGDTLFVAHGTEVRFWRAAADPRGRRIP